MANFNQDESRDTFTSKQIKRAIRSLEPTFGRAMLEALIYDLERYNLALVNDHVTYTRSQIINALNIIFGEAAAKVVIDDLFKALVD